MDLLLYVTDQGQKNHFLQVFEVAKMAGWFDGKDVKAEHIGFGVVTDMSGKKLSSRDGSFQIEKDDSFLSGTPMTLAGLLTDAVSATEKAILATKSLLRSEKKLQQVQRSTIEYQYTPEGTSHKRLHQLTEKRRLHSNQSHLDWNQSKKILKGILWLMQVMVKKAHISLCSPHRL